jgi:hypothetical protein
MTAEQALTKLLRSYQNKIREARYRDDWPAIRLCDRRRLHVVGLLRYRRAMSGRANPSRAWRDGELHRMEKPLGDR